MRSGGRMLVCVCPRLVDICTIYIEILTTQFWGSKDSVSVNTLLTAAITRLSDERWYLNCGRGYEGGNLNQILSPGFKYFYRFSSHLSIWMGLAVMWQKLLLSAEWVSRRVKRHYCGGSLWGVRCYFCKIKQSWVEFLNIDTLMISHNILRRVRERRPSFSCNSSFVCFPTSRIF